jgi:hypothetical protein
LFLLGGFLVARLFFRFRRRAMWGRFGGCGHHHRRFRRWHDAWQRGFAGYHGDQGGDDDPWFGTRQRGRWRPPVAVDARRRLDDALKALELHPRQKAEVDDVLTLVRDELGEGFDRFANIDELLAAIAQPTFDRARAAALLPVPPDRAARLVDELEHLHIILTDEQRATLADFLATPPRF